MKLLDQIHVSISAKAELTQHQHEVAVKAIEEVIQALPSYVRLFFDSNLIKVEVSR